MPNDTANICSIGNARSTNAAAIPLRLRGRLESSSQASPSAAAGKSVAMKRTSLFPPKRKIANGSSQASSSGATCPFGWCRRSIANRLSTTARQQKYQETPLAATCDKYVVMVEMEKMGPVP